MAAKRRVQLLVPLSRSDVGNVTGYGENQRLWLSLRQRRWQDGLGEYFA
jgi:hypothetical protein